jgi:galactose-1-phosphate uridylyltransferase
MLKTSVLRKLPRRDQVRYTNARIALIKAQTELLKIENDILEENPDLVLEQMFSKAQRQRVKENTSRFWKKMKTELMNILTPPARNADGTPKPEAVCQP